MHDDQASPPPPNAPSLADLIRSGVVPEVLPGVFGSRVPRDPDPHRPARNRRPGLFHLFAMPDQDSLATDALLSLCHQLAIVPTQSRVEVLEQLELGEPADVLDSVCLHLSHHGRHHLGE